ncbi:helix-turn-helix transcriptional regulator [Streptomyces benahoarensis]|uniref:helix-turn-helix transcriptional regulator n=1 Tax=Streptomyces benahoarensis TaxID=2595054 RepID=UPI002551F31C|nr:helix-turn-helix domain-containing protein [Streptomyces benahoarensis]
MVVSRRTACWCSSQKGWHRPSARIAWRPDRARCGGRRRSFNVRDAAAYLGISPHTLYVWRHRRQGPPSFRMGPRGRVMYRRTALDAWIHEQERADSRSDPAFEPIGCASAATYEPRCLTYRMLLGALFASS